MKKNIFIIGIIILSVAIIFGLNKSNNIESRENEKTESVKKTEVSTEKNTTDNHSNVNTIEEEPVLVWDLFNPPEGVSYENRALSEGIVDANRYIYNDGMFSYGFDASSGYLSVIKPESDEIIPKAVAVGDEMIKAVKDYLLKIYPEMDYDSGEWSIDEEENIIEISYSVIVAAKELKVVSFIFDNNGVLKGGNLFIDSLKNADRINISEEKAIEIAYKAIETFIEKEKLQGIKYVADSPEKLHPKAQLNAHGGQTFWYIEFSNDDLDGPSYCCEIHVENGVINYVDKSK